MGDHNIVMEINGDNVIHCNKDLADLSGARTRNYVNILEGEEGKY